VVNHAGSKKKKPANAKQYKAVKRNMKQRWIHEENEKRKSNLNRDPDDSD